MAKKLEKLSSTLGSALKACGMQSRLAEYRILVQWEETVGAVIARHARPHRLRGRKLYLSIDSPAWMQQLSFLKPEIIEKLNRSLGSETVKDLALNLGEIGSVEERREEKPRREVPLTAEEQGRVDRIVREIADPEIREALRRLIEKDFKGRKSGTH